MSLFDSSDTIAAIASPSGAGPRGIVRLSGDDAWAIALSGFEADRPEPPPARAEMRIGQLRVDGLRPRLPVSVALWPAPWTYTRQPLAEIHTVGSPPLLRQVLTHCLARGARHAEAGEFTLRAFLSGRLDLTRAEAVLGVIDAQSPAQLDAALRQLAGGLSAPITSLRDRLLDVLAHLEANLDFADESDVDPLGRAALAAELRAASDDVLGLAEKLCGRDRSDGAPRVVLVGPPNAGKSRLFNALVGGAQAIVSPVAGTTRDYVSAFADCHGLTVELVDTAGIDMAETQIEQAAQAQRVDQTARADMLLVCEPSGMPRASESLDLDDRVIRTRRPDLRVTTKCDLAQPSPDTLATSAATGEGLEALRAVIAATLRRQVTDADLPASTSARCRDSLGRAGEALRSAAETVRSGGGDELVAIDLRQAVDELGKVIGVTVTDDILDRIFRRFCIGK
ncbi:MAG: tRNA modification GTPase [Isosphaeraceae bacterium]|nr:tRNA modification GTPase [Isosphaeraceae bacterium]